MKQFKKGLAIFLATVMIVSAMSMIPFVAQSAAGEADGKTEIETEAIRADPDEGKADGPGGPEIPDGGTITVKDLWDIQPIGTLPGMPGILDTPNPPGTDDADAVIYNLGSQEITVGGDPAKISWNYKLFAEDGSYVIQLEDNAFFPYEVQFKYDGATEVKWFDTPDSAVQVGPHMFSVRTNQNDSSKLSQIGVWVNGEYTAAYPEPKEFTNPLFMPMSLFPLAEVSVTLNLVLPDRFMPQAVPVTTVLSGLDPAQAAGADDKVVWARLYPNDPFQSGRYLLVEQADKIDLSSFPQYSTLELIVGSGKQLDETNIRYIVTVRISSNTPSILQKAEVYTEDAGGARGAANFIGTYDDLDYPLSSFYFYLPADTDSVETYFMGAVIAPAYAGYGAKAYSGSYYSEKQVKDELAKNPDIDVTAKIIDQDLTKGGTGLSIEVGPDQDYNYEGEFTLLFYDGSKYLGMQRMSVYIYRTSTGVSLSGLYTDWGWWVHDLDDQPAWEWADGIGIGTFTVYDQYMANEEFYLKMQYVKDGMTGTSNNSYVDKAVVGHFDSLAAAASEADIKSQLFPSTFSSYGAGYKADYSGGGVDFTVFAEGLVFKFTVKTYANPGTVGWNSARLDTPTGTGVYRSSSSSTVGGISIRTYTLYANYPAGDEYHLKLQYMKGGTSNTTYRKFVDKAVVGHFDSLAAAANEADIKDELFPAIFFANGAGYKADYSGGGVDFTVFAEGLVFKFTVKAIDSPPGSVYFGDSSLIDDNNISISASRAPSSSTVGGVSVRTYTLCAGYPADDEYYLRLLYTKDSAAAAVNRRFVDKAVVGHFDSLAAAANEADIKDELFPSDFLASGAGYKADYSGGVDFTVFAEGQVLKYTVKAIDSLPGSIYFNRLYDQSAYTYVSGYASTYTTGSIQTATFTLYPDYAPDDEYYLRLQYTKDYVASDANRKFVDKAVVGHFDTIGAAANAADIKDQLFPADSYTSGAGYKADYSGGGVDFTVFAEGQAYKITVKAVNPPPPYKPSPGSKDTYFQVDGAAELRNVYVLPYAHDTYYDLGFQTVFYTDPVDPSELTPTFWSHPAARIYARPGLQLQVSGASKRSFKEWEGANTATQYAVGAEDGAHLKNYWVSFVPKQTGGSKLYVHGINGDDGPKREVFLTAIHENIHDIFIANVGDAPLTGLKATLSGDAKNIKLDPYWTVGGAGNDTLAPFDSVDSKKTDYGELANVAKIRLIPDGDGEGGISGTLTIEADGQEPVVIELTGNAGNPRLINDEILPEAVKYVPYAIQIMHNNKYSWNHVKLEVVSGALPNGLALRPNGELYGVPQEFGTFTFEIEMTNSDTRFDNDTVEYTLEVLPNTNDNVFNATDLGYELTATVGAEAVPGSHDYVVSEIRDWDFISDGDLGEFIDFWFNGSKLIENVHYTKQPGSTKITIKSQTFENGDLINKTGANTIAGEFRENGDEDNGELRRSAHNFRFDGAFGGDGGGGTGDLPPTNPPTINPGGGQGSTPTPNPELIPGKTPGTDTGTGTGTGTGAGGSSANGTDTSGSGGSPADGAQGPGQSAGGGDSDSGGDGNGNGNGAGAGTGSQTGGPDSGAGAGGGTGAGSQGSGGGLTGDGNIPEPASLAALISGGLLWDSSLGVYYFILDGSDLEFSINIAFGNFKSFSVDNSLLTMGGDYSARSGSTIINIPSTRLLAFATGLHNFKIEFTDQTLDFDVELRLPAAPGASAGDSRENPGTGSSPTTGETCALIIYLAFLSAASGIAVLRFRKLKII